MEANMATSRIVEEETGTSAGRVHPHNGYWAGDFSNCATSQATRVLADDPRPKYSMTTGAQRPVWSLR
jgi:hypothetical protein